MAQTKFEYDAVIKKQENLNSGFIEFPYDVRMEFAGKSRVKVKALIDGYLYRGLLTRMGGEKHFIGINQEVRKAIGKNPGDTVHVVIEEDTEERTVSTPDDFLELLKKDPGLLEFYNKLSFTHRREYVRWIEEAKKEETRKKRLVNAVEMLKNNRKTPDQK